MVKVYLRGKSIMVYDNDMNSKSNCNKILKFHD